MVLVDTLNTIIFLRKILSLYLETKIMRKNCGRMTLSFIFKLPGYPHSG